MASTLTRSDVEIANRGADEFLRVYYATYDSPKRSEGMVKFYRDTSHLTYNGTSVNGAAAIKALLDGIPMSKHEVQSYDCHPIPSTSPPALMITVSGLVTHAPNADSLTATPDTKNARNVDAQPRVFSQSFVLTKQEEKYYVSADQYRFVG
ncbi:hypothetical protein M422DRAFT_25237 [Sphaerobolus stellatus SS14]|nr:hypothetical protein M422DRAFT_25237 [Sphaerobolus stellatus SS14]